MDDYTTEIWKDIVNYEGFYQVSNLGRIKSLNRTTSNGSKIKSVILKGCKSTSGYDLVCLHLEGKSKTVYIHRMVVEHFKDKKEGLYEVDHIDGVKNNNSASNLEWVTRKENMCRSWENGLMENQRKVAVETGKKRAKAVIKMDMFGNVIEKYNSQTEAARENNLKTPHISMCCNGIRKATGGFTWKFSD